MDNNSFLNQWFGLEGRRILLVGAGVDKGEYPGIGWGILKSLLSAGAHVVCTRTTQEGVDAVFAQAEKLGCRDQVTGFPLNFTDPASLAAAKKTFMEIHSDQRLDGIVLNAGGNVGEAVFGGDKQFLIDPNSDEAAALAAEADQGGLEAMQINYWGPRAVVRHFGWFLLKGTQPVVTLVGSVAHRGLNKVVDYGAAKAAAESMVQALSKDLTIDQPNPISVNTLVVGFVKTDQNKWAWDAEEGKKKGLEKRREGIMGNIPLARMAQLEELGAQMVFLQSAAGFYTNGNPLISDGGFGMNSLGNVGACATPYPVQSDTE